MKDFFSGVEGSFALVVGLAVFATAVAPKSLTDRILGTTFTGATNLIKAAKN
jgi:hypothetical protein